MGTGRRHLRPEDHTGWVFNRMVDAYAARPAYPLALIDALSELSAGGARVLDLGAGVGHVALPLAERGHAVTALEPALGMLERLSTAAKSRGIALEAVHGMAEALPVASGSVELVVVADALHFLNLELAAPELARVLSAAGALAVVTCEFTETPFMCALAALMADSAPRRPRALGPSIDQLFAIVGAKPAEAVRFCDQTPLAPDALEAVLRSISFIGPAMNPTRFARFADRVAMLPGPALWARTFTLYGGRRSRGRRS